MSDQPLQEVHDETRQEHKVWSQKAEEYWLAWYSPVWCHLNKVRFPEYVARYRKSLELRENWYRGHNLERLDALCASLIYKPPVVVRQEAATIHGNQLRVWKVTRGRLFSLVSMGDVRDG